MWRGRDRELGDVCAIKVLRPEFASDPAAVTRFVRERTALVKFRHPNVVTLRDMIVEGDSLALVMDFVDGGDLNGYRRNRGGALSPGEALGLTAQVCDALAAAHAAGIVHRDLKPANILLDAGQVRLADFGIARIVGESPATTTGMIMGTIGFMAPEVIRGEEPTSACDVYAVGITLYELLTGAQPFTGQPVAVMRGHLDSMPSRPGGMPDRLWALISACLNKDPYSRPSATVVARALCDPSLSRESVLQGQAASRTGSYGASPWAPDGMPSRPVTYVRPPTSGAYAPRTGPVTASARMPAMAPPATPAPGVMPAAGLAALGTLYPEAGAAPFGASPETEVAAVGIGAGDQPPRSGQPPRPGGAGHRGSRTFGIRPLWATVAAVVLVFAGVAGTYLTMSGGTSSNAVGPQASPLTAPTQSPAAALAKTASPVASHSPSHRATTPAAQPSATAAAPANSADTPSGTPSSAVPAGNPGPTGPNLVADGDFTGNLSDWNNYVTGTVVVSGGEDGGNAARMTGPTVGVSQIVAGLKPGKSYELTGWARSNSGGRTYIGAKNYDSTGDHSHATTSSSWTDLPLSFTEGAGHTTVEIYCWQADAGIGYCSNISLRALG